MGLPVQSNSFHNLSSIVERYFPRMTNWEPSGPSGIVLTGFNMISPHQHKVPWSQLHFGSRTSPFADVRIVLQSHLGLALQLVYSGRRRHLYRLNYRLRAAPGRERDDHAITAVMIVI